jgi:Leucine-rich repeat (LRR) protein
MVATVTNRSIVTHKRTGEINSIFRILPPEVLYKLFSFLEFQGLINASHVCFHWRAVALDATSIEIIGRYKNPELLLSIFHRLKRFCLFFPRQDSHASRPNDLTLIGIVQSLRDTCPTLTDLDLAGCKITDQLVLPLSNFSCLSSLNLAGSRITDVAGPYLASLSSLTYLDLSECKVTNDITPYLTSITSLASLNLSRSRITNAFAPHLASLTSLTSLNLAFCGHLTDDAIRDLTTLSSLTSMVLTYCRITDAVAPHLAALSSLNSLNLSWTAITDAVSPYLADLSFLTDLDLSLCGITDTSISHLASLSSLKKLNLNWCENITEAGIRELVVSCTSIKILRNRTASFYLPLADTE